MFIIPRPYRECSEARLGPVIPKSDKEDYVRRLHSAIPK